MFPVNVFLQNDAMLCIELNRVSYRIRCCVELQHILARYPRLVDHDSIVEMTPLLHVRVELGFPHESRSTGDALVWFLIAVYEPMGIPVVPTVEGFAANFAGKRFRSGVDLLMLLEMFRVDKGRRADVALVRPFTCVACLDVVV